MSATTGATPISGIARVQATMTSPGASRATSATAATRPATPEAAAQATAGAQQAQPTAAAQQQAEVFNAPPLVLPSSPTTRDVLGGLTAAMADPSVNASTAQRLYNLHEQLLNAERSMIQTIIDGLVS